MLLEETDLARKAAPRVFWTIPSPLVHEWVVNYVSQMLVETVSSMRRKPKLLTLPVRWLLAGERLWLRPTGSNLLLQQEKEETQQIKERVSRMALKSDR